MLRNFHPKLWWVVIPFALVIFPPVGVLLAAIALCRTTTHWKVFGDRKMARRIARFDRERARRARAAKKESN